MTTQRSIEPIIPEWDLADRMTKALRVSSLGVGEIADLMGVTRETIGRWTNGHNRPSKAARIVFADLTGVDLAWMEGGEVPHMRARRDSNSQPSDLYPSALERAAIRWGLAA